MTTTIEPLGQDNVLASFAGFQPRDPLNFHKKLRLNAALNDRLTRQTSGNLTGVLNLLIEHALNVLDEQGACLRSQVTVDWDRMNDGATGLEVYRARSTTSEVVPRGADGVLAEFFNTEVESDRDFTKHFIIPPSLHERLLTRTVGNRTGIINVLAGFALDDLERKSCTLRGISKAQAARRARGGAGTR